MYNDSYKQKGLSFTDNNKWKLSLFNGKSMPRCVQQGRLPGLPDGRWADAGEDTGTHGLCCGRMGKE